MIKPDQTHYSFMDGYYGEMTIEDVGFGNNYYIVEAICDLKRQNDVLQNKIFFRIRKDNSNYISIIIPIGLNLYDVMIEDAGGASQYYIYRNLYNFNIVHIVLNTNTSTSVYIDGQRIHYDINTPRIPDLSGNLADINMAGADTTITHNICGLRVWNPTALPVGWEDELKLRVMNPWDRSTLFGDANLKIEYLLNEDVNPASFVIPNSANPGTGDLTITPAGMFEDTVQEYKKR